MREFYYRLQMKTGSKGSRIAEDMLLKGLITADIQSAGEQFNRLNKGDIILIHKGAYPISLVEVQSKINKNNLSVGSLGIDYAVNVLSKFEDLSEEEQLKINLWGNAPRNGTFFKINKGNQTYNKIDVWNNIINNNNDMNILDLIKYKKQVILQGPPGTGKTREAKIIAEAICTNFKLNTSHKPMIIGLFRPNEKLYTIDKSEFFIDKITEEGTFKLKIAAGSSHSVTIEQLIKVDNETKTTVIGDSYATSLIKYAKKRIAMPQIKFIQFHPAYSYEDFVRGIVAESKGTQIEYVTKDKVLASFANEALINWKASTEPKEKVAKESWVQNIIEDFKDFLSEEIENKSEKLRITPMVYISRITDNSIRYNSVNWDVDGGVPISDIIKMYLTNITTRRQIKDNSELTKSAKSSSTYWLKMLELFKKFIDDNGLKPIENTLAIAEKPFVLIIDEINRANLPSVLGELIYALEYRGEKVESMYPIDDNNTLIIPPNLIIIGTMNTADRSVGHIDYAIRRRFAFIDILPKVLQGDDFELDLFKKVSTLFIQNFDEYVSDNTVTLKLSEHLSEEFRPEDVWLGHSYFIKGEGDFALRKKYEIVPILKEYLKDGILKQSAELIINAL